MPDTCARCDHFLPGEEVLSASPPDLSYQGSVGVCRRFPPQIATAEGKAGSRFPIVSREQSCGEYMPIGGWQSPC